MLGTVGVHRTERQTPAQLCCRPCSAMLLGTQAAARAGKMLCEGAGAHPAAFDQFLMWCEDTCVEVGASRARGAVAVAGGLALAGAAWWLRAAAGCCCQVLLPGLRQGGGGTAALQHP